MTQADPRAPMAAAPMKYADDGSVDWGNMWDTFCVLAQDGGPPHRATLLRAPEDADPASPAYQAAADEIIRGIAAVSGLNAALSEPGWIAVPCASGAMARWIADAIVQENVESRSAGALFYVPVGAHFTLGGEVKSVITAVAKTAHYWRDHLPAQVQSAFILQDRLIQAKNRVAGWLRRTTRSDA